MKLLNLCMAVIISLTLGLGAAPVDSFAKDSAKESATSKSASTSKSSSSKSSSSSSKSSTKSSKSDDKKVATKPVNINTASKEDLQMIPGVGPATADAIIKYRKANGKFKSASDLLNVKGIGEKTLKKMKPMLKV